jgi:hypothetical protein
MSFRPKQFQTTRVIDSLIRSDYKQERTITKTKGGKKEQQSGDYRRKLCRLRTFVYDYYSRIINSITCCVR